MKAEDYVKQELLAGRLTYRHIVELVEHWQDSYGLNRDGMPGPATRASLDKALDAVMGKRIDWTPTKFLSAPLPILSGNRRAVVTSQFKTKNPSRPNHNGCDWFYRWEPGDKPDFVGNKGAAGWVKPASPGVLSPVRQPKWVVPYGVSAVAAAPGKVTIAGNSPTGFRCWVDHGNGWRTGYFHLLDLAVHIGDEVKTGDRLGLVGDNPKDGDARHLHFELSPTDRYAPVDPEEYLL